MADSEATAGATPPRLWSHPRSGRDEALTLVAAGFARDLGLETLAKAVSVLWNPRMRTAAGRAFARDWIIELNPRLQDLPEDRRDAELRNTFLHELAHLVAFARVGRKRIAPHGPEWRQACHDLGIPGEDRCHALDFQPRRHAKKFAYTCPACEAVIHRVRRLRRRVACYPCCRKHAGGQYDARFQLRETRLD
ncbi:MAG: SprT-like domain-containing protein [Verrucomicrobiales bacterium]|nr:SprT-like domain-containing protein [Verrucomicrobiales bacterium]